MGTIIIVVILVVIVIFAVKSSMSHMKGEGGCCGGGGDIKPEKKKLEGNKIAEKTIHIEGMHCDHCKNSVERNINSIEGAAAKVNLKKKIAVVSLDRTVNDGILTDAVEKAGFQVTGIDTREV